MNIICEYRTYTNEAYCHKHIYAQLILPCEGSLNITTDHYNLVLNSTQLFYIPPESAHTFSSSDRNRFLVLDIPAWAFPEYHASGLGEEIVLPLDKSWQSLRKSFSGEINCPKPSRGYMHDLVRQASSLLTPDTVPVSVQYIHNHYKDKYCLEKLAQLEHFNPGYYCEWFQKRMGMTPVTYWQKVRLDQARHLLNHTDVPITLIAGMVGYEHQTSFTRMFKKHVGISPNEYRRGLNKNS